MRALQDAKISEDLGVAGRAKRRRHHFES